MAVQHARRQVPRSLHEGELGFIAGLEDQIRDATRSDLDVLITGGTGRLRRLLARVIHRRGARRALPFVVLDKGQFACKTHEGFLPDLPQAATVFLDQVGELTPDGQQALAQLLERRALRRAQPAPHWRAPREPRLVAGTDLDLASEIDGGDFSRMLYYRLNTIHLVLPEPDHADSLGETA